MTSEELDRVLTDPKYRYKVKGEREGEAKNGGEGASAKVSGAEAAGATDQGSAETRAPTDGQEGQECQEDQEERARTHQMTSRSYFKDMQQFIQNCAADKRLTPNTQLVYHTLTVLANRAFWAADFIATDEELMNITHIKSRNALTTSKNKLIALGYISCRGKPNKYTVYSPMVQKNR